MSLKREDCYVGMKVDLSKSTLVYAGSKKPAQPITGKIYKLPKSSNVYVKIDVPVRKGGKGRRVYMAGTQWRFKPSQLMALPTSAEAESLEPDAPSQDPHVRIAEIMKLLDNCTDGVEEFVYLRELHKLLKAQQ